MEDDGRTASTSASKRATRVLGEEYVDPSVRDGRQLQPRVPAARHRVLLGRGVGPLGPRPTGSAASTTCACSPRSTAARSSRRHFRGALRNGCTLDELRDTLIQIMVYAGVPAGVEAFRLAREVLEAEGITPEPAP